jgi:hypothetical protein
MWDAGLIGSLSCIYGCKVQMQMQMQDEWAIALRARSLTLHPHLHLHFYIRDADADVGSAPLNLATFKCRGRKFLEVQNSLHFLDLCREPAIN